MSDGQVMTRLVRKSLVQSIPLNVHFDLTYRCNERCVHCYLDHEDYGELTTSEVIGVLDQLAAASALFLTFSGGEIFLRRDIFELLAHARRLHFDLNLKTNGILITREHAARLRQLGVRKIQISIYSADPAVHDGITEVVGSLKRSLEAIRFLKGQGLVVQIACPLMRQNLGDYRTVQDLARELDITYIIDPTISPRMDGEQSLLALRIAVNELLPVLSDRALNPRNNCQDTAGAGRSDTSDPYENIPCSAAHNSCYISPYGDVYPCVQMPLPAGNLRRQCFQEIWHRAPAMNRVRRVLESQLPICSACTIRKYCQRCPGLAYMEDGDLTGPSERACELAELNARLAGVPNPVSAARAYRPEHAAARGLVTITPATAT